MSNVGRISETYCRVSRTRQIRDRLGTQEARTREYARRRGHSPLSTIYADDNTAKRHVDPDALRSPMQPPNQPRTGG